MRPRYEWPESQSLAAEILRDNLWEVIGKLDHVASELDDISRPTPGRNLFDAVQGMKESVLKIMGEIDDFAADSVIDEEVLDKIGEANVPR